MSGTSFPVVRETPLTGVFRIRWFPQLAVAPITSVSLIDELGLSYRVGHVSEYTGQILATSDIVGWIFDAHGNRGRTYEYQMALAERSGSPSVKLYGRTDSVGNRAGPMPSKTRLVTATGALEACIQPVCPCLRWGHRRY